MVFWKALSLNKKKNIFWLIILQRLCQELPGHLHQWLIKLGDSLRHPWYPCPAAAAAGTENNQPSNPVNEYTMQQPTDYKNVNLLKIFYSFKHDYRECAARVNKGKRGQRKVSPVFHNSCYFFFCWTKKKEGAHSLQQHHKLQSIGPCDNLGWQMFFWPTTNWQTKHNWILIFRVEYKNESSTGSTWTTDVQEL